MSVVLIFALLPQTHTYTLSHSHSHSHSHTLARARTNTNMRARACACTRTHTQSPHRPRSLCTARGSDTNPARDRRQGGELPHRRIASVRHLCHHVTRDLSQHDQTRRYESHRVGQARLGCRGERHSPRPLTQQTLFTLRDSTCGAQTTVVVVVVVVVCVCVCVCVLANVATFDAHHRFTIASILFSSCCASLGVTWTRVTTSSQKVNGSVRRVSERPCCTPPRTPRCSRGG
jgi:hypothetical protein